MFFPVIDTSVRVSAMSDSVVTVVRDVNKGYSLRQCPLFRVSNNVAGLALKPPSRSQKSRVATLAALEEDTDQ